MKQRVRKLLAMVTACVLLLGLVPFTVTAESMEATLELDVPLTVSGTEEEPAYLFFTPEETAWYVFCSYGDGLDPQANLYEVNGVDTPGAFLTYEDDRALDLQFCFAAELTAGVTYCLAADARDRADEFEVVVTEAVPAEGLAFVEGDAAEVYYGYTTELYLTPFFAPENAIEEDVDDWTSSDETVATVDESGYVTILGKGVTVITAVSESGLEATFTLTVKDPEAIVLDTEYSFEALWLMDYALYTFTPTETALYNVWFQSRGQATVQVLEGEIPVYIGIEAVGAVELIQDVTYAVVIIGEESATATLMLQKAPEVEGIELGEDLSIAITDFPFISYELLPMGAVCDEITFVSSDETVLTVDEYGDLYPKAPGSATVTATLPNGATDTVVVTVEEPLAWDGVGTKHIILNPINPEKVYRLTVPENGWYAFTTDGSCSAEVELYGVVDGWIEWIDGGDSENGVPMRFPLYLSTDKTYYLQVDAEEELIAFDLTLDTCEAPETGDEGEGDIPDDDAFLLDTALTVSQGTLFFPRYSLNEDDYLDQIVIEDETVVSYMDGDLLAIGIGTTTVTLVSGEGRTADCTVTVTAAESISVGDTKTVEGETSFVFVPEEDGEYLFYTAGDADPYVTILDSNFEPIVRDDDGGSNWNVWVTAELTAGETYYASFSQWTDDVSFTVMLSYPTETTTMDATVSADDYLFEEDGVYYVETDRGVYLDVAFGPEKTARPEWYELEVDNDEVAYVDYDYVYVQASGAVTVTVTSESGLTATVKLQVIEPVLGDVNTDGVLDEADAALLLAHFQGKKDIGRRVYFAQMNDDEAVDMTDYILLLKSIDSTAFPGVGDVNGDDKTDSTDARLVLQYAVKKIPAEAISLALADVDGNGKVDSTDARLILQFAVKKINEFPVTK